MVQDDINFIHTHYVQSGYSQANWAKISDRLGPKNLKMSQTGTKKWSDWEKSGPILQQTNPDHIGQVPGSLESKAWTTRDLNVN